MIAPDSNRSATARSITTRSPLWVEEVEFGDGTSGFATDGTPVDCVRFADLGLLGERPDLIVSGINHGANLGDDITYSGTVAAALRGHRARHPGGRGLAAVDRPRDGLSVRPPVRLPVSPPFAAETVRRLASDPMPKGTLININCPAGEPTGVEVTHLGKRLYNDELKLVEEDSEGGRRRYQIYGFEPSFEDEEGSDLSAIAKGRISVTPVHFDLTDRGGLPRLRDWDFGGDAGGLADGASPGGTRRRRR